MPHRVKGVSELHGARFGRLWHMNEIDGVEMAVHVTGDTHRWKDLAKLSAVEWPEGQSLTREDYLVILGD